MKLSRRSSLGMFGAAPVAVPQIAAKDLNFGNMGVSLLGDMGNSAEPVGWASDSKKWATDQLANLALRTVADWDFEKRHFNETYRLTPDIASLRSVSLTMKMQWAKDAAYERFKQNRMERLLREQVGL